MIPEHPIDQRYARGARGSGALWWALAILLWVSVALWLYTPFLARPYDVVDFFDYLPILRGSDSTFDAVGDLTRHYLQQGRFNLAAFAGISAKWSLFGGSMLGWQVLRFVEMLLLCWLAFRLLRELGSSRLGATGGSVIFLASPPAAVGWMRMNTAEPSGSILLIVFMLLMLRWTEKSIPAWGLAVIALTVVGIGLFKEFLLVTVAVPAVVLTCLTASADSGGLRALLRSRRLLFTCIGGLLVAVPAVLVVLHAPTQAYSRQFATSPLTLGSALLPLIATLFPFAPADSSGGIPLLLGVSAYVLILVSGWGLLLQGQTRSREALLLFALGLGLPLSGAVAYAAWPNYALMYALPFQVGTAVLVAAAVTALGRYRRQSRPLVIAGGVLILALMGSAAQRYSRFVSRSLTMTRDLAVYVGTLDPMQPVRLEACPGLRPELWSSYGHTVGRYAASLGVSAPPVLDSPCRVGRPDDARSAEARRIVLSDAPVPGMSPSEQRKYAYVSFDWRTLTFRENALVVALRSATAR